MISDAYVMVTCDKCGTSDEVELTALAQRGSYDTRNVRSRIESWGWSVGTDDTVLCGDCQPAHQEPAGE